MPGTRTAIAIKRNPSLLITATPHPLQLTATNIMYLKSVTPATLDPFSAEGQMTMQSEWDTAQPTFVAAMVTLLSNDGTSTLPPNPFPSLTPSPTPAACIYQIDYIQPVELDAEIDALMQAAASKLEPANSLTTIITRTGNPACEGSELLETRIRLHFSSDTPPDESARIEGIERVLSLLVEHDFRAATGLRARLDLSFTGRHESFYIDTDYENAMSAYREGLRGAELITALGEFLRVMY
jgi:hypothetical protein